MKKIINGKLYNTETAIELTEQRKNTHGERINQSLYRKKNGEYFLYEFGIFLGDPEKIIPFSENMARNWVEVRCSAEKYESIFGEVEE